VQRRRSIRRRNAIPRDMSVTIVGVIGASRASDELEALAEEVGAEVARNGAALVCGGLTGVMEAACRGARSEGGLTIGILPSDSREDANPHIQIPIVTGMGMSRNIIVVKTADVLVAVGGEYGTLSEIAYALNNGKKVFSVRSWELEKARAGGVPDLVHVDDPREAVRMALSSLGDGA
jgi:uncharacterized protein (TIGR00725 family)